MWAKLDTLLISLPIVLLGLVCLYRERRYIDLLTLGEETASTMGIDPKRSFFITTFGVALLVGALLLLMADICVQYIPLFSHIYIGTLTAIIGAPCLIWILIMEQRKLAR